MAVFRVHADHGALRARRVGADHRPVQLEDLIEAAVAEHRKLRALTPLELRFEKITAERFEQQEARFWRWVGTPKPKVDISEALPASSFPEPTSADWDNILGGVGNNYDQQAFHLASQSLLEGAQDSADALGVSKSFALPNPNSIAYLNNYSAQLVANIDQTTRITMMNTLRNARAAGYSYEKTAKEISMRWSTMSVPRPQQHIRSRAHMIAVTETAAAYEQGNLHTYNKIQAAGIPLEYAWMVVGDGRVCPVCDGHASLSWQPASEWAGTAPPAHPACRCTLNARPDKGKAGQLKLDKLKATKQTQFDAFGNPIAVVAKPKPKVELLPPLPKTPKFKTPKPTTETLDQIKSLSQVGLKPGQISQALTAMGKPLTTAQVRYYIKKMAADQAKKFAPKVVAQQQAATLRTAVRSTRRAKPPKTFADEFEAIDYMKQYVPPGAHPSFASYSRLSYERINGYARQKAGFETVGPTVKAHVRKMDANMVALKDDIMLERGVGLDSFLSSMGDAWPDPKDWVGKTITDKGFASTSAGKPGFSKQVQLKITAPEGTKGAWLAPTQTAIGNYGKYYRSETAISAHAGEMEFLLARGTSFRVTKVSEEVWYGARKKYTVEVVAQQPLSPPRLP